MERTPSEQSEPVDPAVDLISKSEKDRILAQEEYRLEVRRQLEDKAGKKRNESELWKEKVVAPAVIVLLTVALSGYVVPKVLEQSQKTQRAREITANMLDEIALQTGEMQVAIDSHADALDTYWIDSARTNAIYIEFVVKRNIGAIKDAALAKENELTENDRKRLHARADAAVDLYNTQVKKFLTWANRSRVRIGTLYPESASRAKVESSLERIRASVSRADAALEEKDSLYDAALNGHLSEFKNLRPQLDTKVITAAEYQRRAAPIVGKLRNLDQIQGPPRLLDNAAIDEMMETLQAMKPAP